MQMRYAVLKSPYKVEIRSQNVPVPDNNQVLVKTAYCGICGTDKIAAQNWCPDWTPFGHEVSGTVEAVGKNVTGFTKGQKVAVKPGSHCGKCVFCKSGNYRKCVSLIANQHGFSEFIIADPLSLVSAPDTLSLKALSLCEPLNVALDAIETVQIKKDDSVILVGPGLIGLLALYVSKNIGANIAGIIGRNRHYYLENHLKNLSVEFFEIISNSNFLNSSKRKRIYREIFNKIAGKIKNRLIVIHTAPPKLIEDYIYELPYESSVINIGLAPSKKQLCISLDMQKLMFRRIQLLSSFSVPSLYFEKAVELLSKSIINPDLFIKKTISINEIGHYLSPGSKNKSLKVSVSFDQGKQLP